MNVSVCVLLQTPWARRGDAAEPSLPLPLLLAEGGAHAGPHLGVQQRAREHQARAQPVGRREGVAEIQDGEDEAHELPQGHHQRDGERRALRGQGEHAPDAHVSERRGG